MKRTILIVLILALIGVVLLVSRPAEAGPSTDPAQIGCTQVNEPCTWRFVDEAYGVVCYVTQGTGEVCIQYK